MVPSGCGLRRFKVGMCEDRGCFAPCVFLHVVAGREVALQLTFVVNREMAGHNPLSKEGSWEGCHCSWCGGDRDVGRLGKEVADLNLDS